MSNDHMKMQKSYIKRIFFSMLMMMVLLLFLMGCFFVVYTQKTIGNELIELNQSVLSQAATRTSRVLQDTRGISDELAWDSRIVEGMAAGDESDEFLDYVEHRISDTIWKDYQRRRASQIFFCGAKGWTYPKDSAYSYEDLQKLYESRAIPDQRGPVLLSYHFEAEEKGLFRYTFQLVQEIRDLLTGEGCGYILLNVSEKELWESYMELDGSGIQYCILDQNGTVVSSRDKRMIGTLYSVKEGTSTGRKGHGYYISDNRPEQPIYIYGQIPTTDWYLMGEVKGQAVWKNLNHVKGVIGAGIFVSVAVFLLMFLYFSRKTMKPVKEIENKMSMAAGGDFKIRANVMQQDEFGQIAESFNTMVEKIDGQVQEIREMEKKKRMAELDFLKAQINPHFIYNTLSSIRFYVEMEQGEKAGNMLLNFSGLLRKTLSRSEEIITLQEELDAIKEYVELQKMRYADQFELWYDVAEETMDCLIPNFITQPIVENAIFYSVGSEESAEIYFRTSLKGENLEIRIEDHGSGMTQEKIDQVLKKELNINRVGVRNVKERIQLIYGHKYGLWIDSSPGQGTVVRLTMPAERKNQGGGDQDEDSNCGR